MKPFNTLGKTDVMNLRQFKEGVTVQRLTMLPEWMVKEIVEKGGAASCDGKLLPGIVQPLLAVWLKFELKLEGNQLVLIDHSFKTREVVRSVTAAREVIRHY